MPRNICCVPGCPVIAEDGVPQHYFPSPQKDAERFQYWVKVIGGDIVNLDSTTIHKTRRVCRRHFQKEFLYPKNRLCKLAVPSLLLPPKDVTETAYIHEHKYAKREHFDHNYYGRAAQDLLPGTTKAYDEHSIHEPHSRKTLIPTDSAKNKNGGDCAVVTDGAVNSYSADGDIHDGDTQEETDDQLFSWQRDSEINCDDYEINPEDSTILQEDASELNSIVIETEYDDTVEINNLEDIRLETDSQALNTSEESDVHEGYKCDMCKGPIRRFRYSCVECANYDLCGACEARAAHPQHYLLRVPRPRPHAEIKLIMDTIRRFLVADPKSLRAEANFVDTLMDEMKSEVLSEAGSDPVPDEPDYPVQSDDSSDEHDYCEMVESDTTHTPATQDDDAQDVTCRDEDLLEEWEFPQEMYNTLETMDNNDVKIARKQCQYRESNSHTRSQEQNVHIRNKTEQIIVDKVDSLSPSNTLGKVGERKFVTYPKKTSISNDVPEYKRKTDGQTLNKVSKRIYVTCPKTVSISENAHKLLKTKDGDTMERTINTIKHSLQSKAFIQLQRLSKEEMMSAKQS